METVAEQFDMDLSEDTLIPEQDQEEVIEPQVIDGRELNRLDTSRNYPVVLRTDIIQKNKYLPGDNAGNSLTTMEYRIIYAMVSRISKYDTELKPQEFDIASFCKLCGINLGGGRTWRNIRNILIKLAKRAMWLYDIDGETGKEHYRIIRWLQDVDVSPADKKITLYFDQKMKPFLIGLSENYTKLYLHDTLRMRSKYSMILYQLLMSYAFIRNPVTFKVDDFLARMDCVKPSYKNNFNLVKTRVIEPALKEINKYSALDVKVQYVNKEHGRGVEKIRFIVRNLADNQRATYEDSLEYARRFDTVEQELTDAGVPAYGDGSYVVDRSYMKDFDASERDTVSPLLETVPPLFAEEMDDDLL